MIFLMSLVRSLANRNLAAVDHQHRSLIDIQIPGQLHRSFDRRALASGVAAQAAIFAGSRPALVTALFRVSVAPSGCCKTILAIEHGCRKLEECSAAALLGYADAIRGGFHGLRDESLRADSSQRQCEPWESPPPACPCWPAHPCNGDTGSRQTRPAPDPLRLSRDRPVGSLLQHGAKIRKRMFAEGKNLIAGDDVFSVRKGKELNALPAFACRSCRPREPRPC